MKPVSVFIKLLSDKLHTVYSTNVSVLKQWCKFLLAR